MDEFVVQVTKKHISVGDRKHCRFCPVALAVRKHDDDACVLHGSIMLWGHAYNMSDELERMIYIFDHEDATMVPFTLKLTRQDGKPAGIAEIAQP